MQGRPVFGRVYVGAVHQLAHPGSPVPLIRQGQQPGKHVRVDPLSGEVEQQAVHLYPQCVGTGVVLEKVA